MNKSTSELLAVAALCVVLPACQSIAPVSVVSRNISEHDLNIAQKLGEAAPHTPVTFSSEHGLKEKTVTVGETYNAASGRVCRRLFDNDQQPLYQVVCRSETERWVLQKSLKVKTASYSVSSNSSSYVEALVSTKEIKANYKLLPEELPVASDYNLSEPIGSDRDVNVMNLSLDGNETLWSFSVRVTGNGENWETIAAVNNIEDALRMPALRLLSVPVSMLKNSYVETHVEPGKVIGQ